VRGEKSLICLWRRNKKGKFPVINGGEGLGRGYRGVSYMHFSFSCGEDSSIRLVERASFAELLALLRPYFFSTSSMGAVGLL